MRLLVCGSRTFEDTQVMFSLLDGIAMEDVQNELEFVLIHGDAPGADRLAAQWGEQVHVQVDAYPADWETHGKRAGYLRNALMLNEGQPDLVVAFVDKPLAESKGTAMMVDLARKAGVKTIVVEVLP